MVTVKVGFALSVRSFAAGGWLSAMGTLPNAMNGF
jgi:hypothetical protein